MSQWQALARFPLEAELQQIDQALTQRGIEHRFTEELAHQYLWLANPREDKDTVLSLIQQWQQEGLAISHTDLRDSAQSWADLSQLWAALKQVPMTSVILLLGILGALLVSLDTYQYRYVRWLLFFPLDFNHGLLHFHGVGEYLARGQYWRLITPVFLHFGIMHVTFNSLWIWYFGRRIEQLHGTRLFAVIFFATALGGNLVQGVLGGASVFGGLSGVVYGLMGYIWVWQWKNPESPLGVQPGVLVFMIVWLALGVFGWADFLMPGSVANGAHLGGLVGGMLMAMICTKFLAGKSESGNVSG